MEGERRTKAVRYEQAVYGSFPFWHRGYAVLAASAGCRPRWLDALQLAAQRFGERPAGIAEKSSLLALPLPRGPWMIVGVFPMGCDDRGRPGALAFHALFVGPWSYRRAGANPFLFVPSLRRDWFAGDEGSVLPQGQLVTSRPEPVPGVPDADGERVETIVAALKRGRRVTLVSPEPIDDLAREVWGELPGRLRRRASVATWAFDNTNRFDLVAVPRLGGLIPGPLELVLERDPAGTRTENPAGPAGDPVGVAAACRPHGRRPKNAILVPLAALLAIVAALSWWGVRHITRPAVTTGEAASHEPASARIGPAEPREPSLPGKGQEPELTPDERRRLIEALVDMVERFCPRQVKFRAPGVGSSEATDPEPGALMLRLAGCLRYSGASLSAAELVQLGAGDGGTGPGPDAAMALRWHALIRRFAGGRPIPGDFRDGPTRWQLATLAWSWRVDDDPGVVRALTRGLPDEVVHALADVLSLDVPVPSTSLSGRHPALDDYRAFLGRLPRK